MHGTGTGTVTGTCSGIDGSGANCSWNTNVKHGLGRKRYANGDVFEGSWKQGMHDGAGRYVWENRNEYIGDWKGGLMNGRGRLTWANGDHFDGFWLDGLGHGHGVYTWADGTRYVGTWSKGLKDGKGIFYPAGSTCMENEATRDGDFLDRKPSVEELWTPRRSRGMSLDFDPVIRHSGDVAAQKSLSGEQGCNLESITMESFENEEYWMCGVETVAPPIVEREYVQGVLMNEVVKQVSSCRAKHVKRRHRRQPKEIKRPGETIIKGHRSYDLMLNLQLGIRYTVGKITPESKREIGFSDFGRKARFKVRFPKEGSQLTPPHQSVEFKWKDYCPMVFRHLRELFKIDAADYMLSLCGNDALRELSSPGKSGSVFYLSHDDRFMIKTMRKSEVKVLLEMLPSYYEHVHMYDNTLITKFFGLHRIKPFGGRKVRFVVMGNMFCTELRIHRRFDLKGSSQGRSTDKVEIDENTTLKDLDLDFVFFLEPTWRETLLNQIESDCKFLESQRIMDYSLLLGIHFRAPQHPAVFSPVTVTSKASKKDEPEEDWTLKRGLVLVAHGSEEEAPTPGSHVRGSPLKPAGNEEVDLLLPGTARLRIRLGVNMPARADRTPLQNELQVALDDEVFGEVYDVVLYFGIIDILQQYDLSKRVEHAYKSLQYDSASISAVDPTIYAQRFQDFIRVVFPGF